MKYFILVFTAVALIAGASPAHAFGAKPLQAKDRLQLFPSYGVKSPKNPNRWKIHFIGRVYSPVVKDSVRGKFVHALAEAMDVDEHKMESKIFRERLSAILSDSEERREVQVSIEGNTAKLLKSDDTGFVRGNRLLPLKGIGRGDFSRAVAFSALPSPKNSEKFNGEITLLSDRGISVISDIDDTVKITDVQNRKEMLKNTFLRPFAPVPGMPELYRRWKKAYGDRIFFHFVSSTPWQLYEPLKKFMDRYKVPAASWQLRSVSIKDVPGLMRDDSSELFKTPEMEYTLEDLPGRRFILVGDSGEKDPETYAQIQREFPDQVAAILIRNVTNEPKDSPRYRRIISPAFFSHLYVFKKPSELPPIATILKH